MVEKLSKLFILFAILCFLVNCINAEKTYMTEDEYEAENEELSKLKPSPFKFLQLRTSLQRQDEILTLHLS